jgi:hypothetical protein
MKNRINEIVGNTIEGMLGTVSKGLHEFLDVVEEEFKKQAKSKTNETVIKHKKARKNEKRKDAETFG